MTLRERWNRTDWLLIGGLLVLVVLIFWRFLFNRNWSFGVELDFLRQFYPARFYEAKSLSGGTFPLWSPYILSGQPFYASYQTAMLYPFNILLVGIYGAIGADWSLKAQCVFVVFHFYLAGLFTYILARDLRVGRAGASVAAVTFMLCGFMTAHAGHLNQMSAAAWMPLIFFLFNRSLTRRRLSYAIAAGAAMGIALLAGHLQSIFYLCVILLGLAIFYVWRHYRGDETQGAAFSVAALALTVGIAAGLAAVQIVPLYELIGLSTRTQIPYSLAVTASLPRWQTVNLIFPHFFGSSPENYVGGWAMWETYGYAGIVGGALGIVALLKKPRGFAIFLWVVLMSALVLAIGPGAYVWTLLFKLGIFVNRFRDPARVLVVFGFASALLAGLGADYLVENVRDQGKEGRARYRAALRLASVVTAAVVVLAAGLTAYVLTRGSRPKGANGTALLAMFTPLILILVFLALLFITRRSERGKLLLSVGLVVLVLADLVALNTLWIAVEINPKDPLGDRAASRYIAAQPGTFRVETDANTMYKAYDDGALYGLDKTAGDDSLVLEDYFDYRDLIVPQQGPGVQVGLFYEGGLRSELLDVQNDTYFLTRKPINPILSHDKFELKGKFDGVYVYRNKTAMPRAWMSDAYAFLNNEDVLAYMKEMGPLAKGLRETALVVYPRALALLRTHGANTTEHAFIPAVKGNVSVEERSAHTLKLATDPSSKGLLVVSEVYYPGWDVYVDGKKRDILKTDLMFRGVMLDGGQKTVEFRFHPSSLHAGAVASMVTLALLAVYFAVLLAMGLVRKKKARIEAVRDSAGPQRGIND